MRIGDETKSATSDVFCGCLQMEKKSLFFHNKLIFSSQNVNFQTTSELQGSENANLKKQIHI